MALLNSMWQIVSDWLLAIVVALGGGATTLGTVIKRNRDRSMDAQDRSKRVERTAAENERRSKKTKRRLEGDPDDPNTDGLLDIVYETRADVNELRTELKDDHREVIARLDDMADENGDDDRFYRGDDDGSE